MPDDATPTEPTQPEPEGTEPTTPDPENPEGEAPEASIPELPADIESAEEADLRELHGQLDEVHAARRQTARTQADIDALADIRSRQNTIVSELNRRREEEQRVIEQLTALDAEPAPTLPDAVPAMATVSAAQVASLRGRQPGTAQNPPTPAAARPRVAMMAGASTEIVPAGSSMDWAQLGQAFDRAKRGRSGQAILASLPSFEEMGAFDRADMLSSDHGASFNDRLMSEAQRAWKARRRGETVEAKVAAICGPLDYIRDIPDAFSTAEPVSGIFPSRPAGRLGYQFTPSVVLSDVASGVTLWDETDQGNVDPTNSATWKPCVEVECPSQTEVRAEAVPACITFDITTEMSNPERIANATRALMAVKARTKEARVLQVIDSLSHAYSFEGAYGALPAVIEALNTIIAQLTYANRLDDPDYTLIVPPAVAQLLTIDRASRAYGAEAETSDVLTYLRSNVDGVSEVVRSLDASAGTAGADEPGLPFSALPTVGQANRIPLPWISCATYRLRLVAPEAALYSETGEVNVGVGRDTNLQRQNRAQYFTEDFFMLAKSGPQPWATLDIQLRADGSRAGLVEPVGCAS